jgi:hypothetical protein
LRPVRRSQKKKKLSTTANQGLQQPLLATTAPTEGNQLADKCSIGWLGCLGVLSFI